MKWDDDLNDTLVDLDHHPISGDFSKILYFPKWDDDLNDLNRPVMVWNVWNHLGSPSSIWETRTRFILLNCDIRCLAARVWKTHWFLWERMIYKWLVIHIIPYLLQLLEPPHKLMWLMRFCVYTDIQRMQHHSTPFPIWLEIVWRIDCRNSW